MTKLDELRAALKHAGVEALWVSDPANIRVLTGFTDGKDAKVLVTETEATLYTDARYTVQAQEESSVPQFIARPPATYEHAAASVKGKRVGIEAESLTVAAFEDLQKHWPDSTLVPLRGVMQGLRVIKDQDEIKAIRAAQDLADRVYAEVRPMIKAGARELDIANEIESRLRQAGGSSAFGLIVASGPNGAKPHAGATERVIQDGELVTVDMGAKLGGYNSDMTRTVAVGKPSDELVRMYNAVLEAEQAAVKAIKPGVRAADLDKLARDILVGHGLGEAFAHSLGHGVGLEVHEGPGLRGSSEEVLAAGMIITIEPGVYIAGLGGVRIEDLVLVTDTGYEVLSHAVIESL